MHELNIWWYMYILLSSHEVVPDGNADEATSYNGHHNITLSENSTATGQTRWRGFKEGEIIKLLK